MKPSSKKHKKDGKSKEKPEKVKPGQQNGLQVKINTAAKDDWLRRVGGGKLSNSDLLGRHPFRNTLPELPMDPKFLKQSSEILKKQAHYKTSTIECRYQHPIQTENDLGVAVNLIDPSAYHFYDDDDPAKPELHPEDRFLAEFRVDLPGTKKASTKARPRVSWLRKTEYMSNDLYEPAQKFKSQHDTMNTMREQTKKRDTEGNKTVDERIADIEATFEKAQTEPVHPFNKKLTARTIHPLLPDIASWENQYTGIQFDDDAYSATEHTKVDAGRALIKAYKQQLEEGVPAQQFVGYMLPKKRPREEDEDKLDEDKLDEEQAQEAAPSEFEWVRNYSFAHEMVEGEQTIILVIKKETANIQYVTMKAKLALHRIAQQKELAANQYKPSRVDVTRRNFRSFEKNARGRRKRDELQLEYESQPESEPEPDPEPEAEAAAEAEAEPEAEPEAAPEAEPAETEPTTGEELKGEGNSLGEEGTEGSQAPAEPSISDSEKGAEDAATDPVGGDGSGEGEDDDL